MESTAKQKLLKNIKYLMREHNWDIPELGRRSKVSSRTIRYIFNEPDRSPTLGVIEKIADTFNLSVEQLLSDNISSLFASEESEEVQLFNKLTEEQRQSILSIVRNFSELNNSLTK